MTVGDDQKIQAAVGELAAWLYDQQAKRSDPPFSEQSVMVRHAFIEGALGLINKVLGLVKPIDTEAEVLRLHVKMLADEVRARRGWTSGKIADTLEQMIEAEPFEPADKKET